MEIEVLDLSQKTNCEKENDLPTAMDLSQKSGSVICVSEDEEDENINEIISQLNTESPSEEVIESCQKLLRQLNEKLRNAETLEILLAQMKMTQRRSNLSNGLIPSSRQNGVVSEGKVSESVAHVSMDVSETQSPVNVVDNNASTIRLGVPSISSTPVVNLGMETSKAGLRMTREMAMQALDQQYMARKALLRKQADKSLSEIPLARPSQGALAQSDLNVVPSTTTNEFVALVGLEEVVKNLQEYRNIAMGQKPTDMKLVFTPFNCVQCSTDFTPLWKRERPGSSSVVCESCCSYNYRKAVQKDYQEKIKLVLKKYQDQERDLDRDYKDMLDSPKKFELFRKEQEKKLLAMTSSSSTSRPSVSNNNQHNQPSARSSTAHHHQSVTSSTPVTQQSGRSVHRSSNINNNTPSRTPTSTSTAQQQYGQQPLRHQNNNNTALSTGTSSASQLTVDQLAYMQMFQALNQLGSSNTNLETYERNEDRKRRLARNRKDRWVARQSKESLEKLRKIESQRTAGRRALESEEQRRVRQQTQAQRIADKRANETPEQRKARQKAEAIRRAEKRANETAEERKARQQAQAIRISERRANETPEQRKARQESQAIRVAEKRANESIEQKRLRQRAQATRIAERRANESTEQWERRRENDTERYSRKINGRRK